MLLNHPPDQTPPQYNQTSSKPPRAKPLLFSITPNNTPP
jgi:hypothetical protein